MTSRAIFVISISKSINFFLYSNNKSSSLQEIQFIKNLSTWKFQGLLNTLSLKKKGAGWTINSSHRTFSFGSTLVVCVICNFCLLGSSLWNYFTLPSLQFNKTRLTLTNKNGRFCWHSHCYVTAFGRNLCFYIFYL